MFVVAGNILGGIPYWFWPDNPLTQELSIVATDITLVSIVIATGIAILRYRLWDIDILINRTLVYFSLTALIVGLYVVIVGSLGACFKRAATFPCHSLPLALSLCLFSRFESGSSTA